MTVKMMKSLPSLTSIVLFVLLLICGNNTRVYAEDCSKDLETALSKTFERINYHYSSDIQKFLMSDDFEKYVDNSGISVGVPLPDTDLTIDAKANHDKFDEFRHRLSQQDSSRFNEAFKDVVIRQMVDDNARRIYDTCMTRPDSQVQGSYLITGNVVEIHIYYDNPFDSPPPPCEVKTIDSVNATRTTDHITEGKTLLDFSGVNEKFTIDPTQPWSIAIQTSRGPWIRSGTGMVATTIPVADTTPKVPMWRTYVVHFTGYNMLIHFNRSYVRLNTQHRFTSKVQLDPPQPKFDNNSSDSTLIVNTTSDGGDVAVWIDVHSDDAVISGSITDSLGRVEIRDGNDTAVLDSEQRYSNRDKQSFVLYPANT